MFLCLCHDLVYTLFFHLLHVMFTLYFIAFFDVFVFRLSFIFSFILHPLCIIPLLISSFLSLISLYSFVYSWQKGGEYTEVYRHFHTTHVHILRGRNSNLCIFVEGESHRRDAYSNWEKTSFYEKTLFYLFYFILVFSLLYDGLIYV